MGTLLVMQYLVHRSQNNQDYNPISKLENTLEDELSPTVFWIHCPHAYKWTTSTICYGCTNYHNFSYILSSDHFFLHFLLNCEQQIWKESNCKVTRGGLGEFIETKLLTQWLRLGEMNLRPWEVHKIWVAGFT